LLTSLEKKAGRAFRDAAQAALDALNAADPPGQYVLPLWRVVRHECRAAGGASTGITLREVREPSPEYRACCCGAVAVTGPDFPHRDCDGSRVAAAAGQFAVIRKEGKCSGCGLAVRSRAVRFVAASDHPSRERQASARHRDS
jgi:hypothetical protein